MKKTLIALFLVLTITSLFTVSAFADEAELKVTSSTEYIPLPDGGYIVVVLNGGSAEAAPGGNRSYTVNDSKSVMRYNADNDLIWQYTLYGTFSVEYGVSAVCTNATYSTVSNSSFWTFSDCSATASGNTAYGAGTVKDKFLFITLETVIIDIHLTCDIYGHTS